MVLKVVRDCFWCTQLWSSEIIVSFIHLLDHYQYFLLSYWRTNVYGLKYLSLHVPPCHHLCSLYGGKTFIDLMLTPSLVGLEPLWKPFALALVVSLGKSFLYIIIIGPSLVFRGRDECPLTMLLSFHLSTCSSWFMSGSPINDGVNQLSLDLSYYLSSLAPRISPNTPFNGWSPKKNH